MDTLERLDKTHDVNYKWYFVTLQIICFVAENFMVIQLFGMMFTYFAMFKSMLAYTIVMWIGTLAIFTCMGLTLANKGQVRERNKILLGPNHELKKAKLKAPWQTRRIDTGSWLRL